MSAPLSPAGLTYLFAERVATGPSEEFSRIPVPSGAEVDAIELALKLVTISLWSLREQRVVALQQTAELPRNDPEGGGAQISFVQASLEEQRAISGLEGVLARSLADPGRARPGRTGLRWSVAEAGWDGKQPWSSVVSAAANETIASGYVELRRRRLIGARTPRYADPTRVAELEPWFEDAWQRYEAFRRSEPGLSEAVDTDVLLGLQDAFAAG